MGNEFYGSDLQVKIEEIVAVLIVVGVIVHIFGRIYWGW
jgi:hypothetical protein